MKRRAVSRVPTEADGVRLVDLLTRRFTYHDRHAWEERIREGRLRVDGETVRDGQFVLRRGQVLEYLPEERPEPPVDATFRVVYEDETLLVLDKSGNLPCHPAGPYFHNTLWALLKERYEERKLHFVHRLDRETSGLVVVAFDAETAGTLGRDFAAGRIRKTYLAWVEGSAPERWEAHGELVPDPASPVRKKQVLVPCAEGAANVAHTAFRCVRRTAELSLVEARPTTGRLHQIRASLHSTGFPLVGDKLYGVNDRLYLRFVRGELTEDDRRRLRLPRQALHAAGLDVVLPADGQDRAFRSPLPADIREPRR